MYSMEQQLCLFPDLVTDIGTDAGKTCVKCERYLTLTSYGRASGGNYLRSECNNCASELQRVRNKLRFTVEPPANDHSCPVCNRSGDQVSGHGGKGHKTPWVLDHDHRTNEARGWLCHTCNRALGGFNDDIDILQNAVHYLSQFSEPINDNEKAHP